MTFTLSSNLVKDFSPSIDHQAADQEVMDHIVFLEKLIQSVSPEVQDEFYAIADNHLRSSRSLAILKFAQSYPEKGYAHYRLDKSQVAQKIDKTYRLIQYATQKAWKALRDSEKKLYKEISQKENPRSILTIFTALHAHNLMCVGEALGLVHSNVIKTRKQFLKAIKRVSQILSKDHPKISPFSLRDRGITSIPREISYAGMQKRELIVERVKNHSFASLSKTARAWYIDTQKSYAGRGLAPQDWNFRDPCYASKAIAECLESKYGFETAYVCKDVLLQRIQGIMLTKRKNLVTEAGKKMGNFVHVVELLTHPDNLRFSINLNAFSRVEGSGTALISYAVHECLRHNLAGVFLESSPSADKFYEKLGFKYLPQNKIKTEQGGKPMILKAEKIKRLLHKGKFRIRIPFVPTTEVVAAGVG
jgi:hypothetical protein